MKTMTKEQLAELLNGNEYRDEMTTEQERIAKENNLLVLFGASDDNLEMRGAIYDEAEAWDGGEYALALDGELYADAEEENTWHKAKGNEVLAIYDEYDNDDNPRLIRAEWCPEDQPRLSWRITSNEQSKRLLELGVPAKSASMCWVKDPNEGDYYLAVHDEFCYEVASLDPIPSFTVGDLLEIMPNCISTKSNMYTLVIRSLVGGGWYVFYKSVHTASEDAGGGVGHNLIDLLIGRIEWLLANDYKLEA